MIDLSDIRARARAINAKIDRSTKKPGFMSVSDCVSASDAIETGDAIPPALYVSLARESAEPNRYTTGGHGQRVNSVVSLLFCLGAERADDERADPVEVARGSLIAQFTGWMPKGAGRAFDYAGYSLRAMGGGLVWGEVLMAAPWDLGALTARGTICAVSAAIGTLSGKAALSGLVTAQAVASGSLSGLAALSGSSAAQSVVTGGIDQLYAGYSLALDFRTPYHRSGNTVAINYLLLPGATFARSSAKSRFGSDGVLYTASVNQPLITNDGLWVEGAFTNYCLYSQTFTDVSWLTIYGTATKTTGQPDPAGGSNAVKVVGVGNWAWGRNNGGLTAGLSYTGSYWLRADAPVTINLQFYDGTTVITIPVYLTTTWKQFYGLQQIAGTTFRLGIASPVDATIYAYQGQIVAGQLPGPIIVTNGATVTIPADDARLSQPIPADGDLLFFSVANVTPDAINTKSLATISDGTLANRLNLALQITGLFGGVVAGGSILINTAAGLQTVPGQVLIGLRRRGGKYASFAMNSVGATQISPETGVVGFPAGMNRIDIGYQVGLQPVNGPIKLVDILIGTYSDAEVIEIMKSAAPTPDRFLGSSLLGYWDAARSDKMTLSGSQVTAWVDIVNGYTVTQGFGGQRPLYASNSFNGGPGLTFDGIDDFLELVGNPFPTSGPLEVWAIVDQLAPITDTTGRIIFSMGGASTASRLLLSIGDGSTQTSFLAGANNTSATRQGFTGKHVGRGIIDADGVTAVLDGITSSKVPVNTLAANTRIRVGAVSASTPAGYFKGVIAAILVTSPLNSSQVAQLLDYSKMRTGI